jgi:NTE family protein
MTVMDRRALVLGGGGVTGIAWQTGLIAGLAGLASTWPRPT